MTRSPPKPDRPLPSPAVLDERDALIETLLGAAAGLTEGATPEAILRRACDVLVAASPRIRLAWMFVGDPDADAIRPAYAAGPARSYAEQLVIDKSPANMRGPGRRALATRSVAVARIRSDDAFDPWREAALAQGLEAVAALPFGSPDGARRGIVGIYTDQPDYFDRVGLEPLVAFGQLGSAALGQAALRERLRELATVDELTGLLNRRAMHEILEREHARAARHGRGYGLLLFDLDRFKLVNDGYGHAVGDRLLREVAETAQGSLREGDWLARWGGEEFLCLLPDTDRRDAGLTAERLRQTLATAVLTTQRRLQLTVSIGVAHYPHDGRDVEALLNAADLALYHAKRGGRNRVVFADAGSPGMFSMASQVVTALEEGRIDAAFQPIVDLADGEVVAEEALARLVMPDGRVLAAAEFMEAADELQLVHRIDEAVIAVAMSHCASQRMAGLRRLHFVNMSGDLLRRPELIARILSDARRFCEMYGESIIGEDKPLVIEITEREFLGDTGAAARALAPVTDFGLRLAVDDFGSGYSSFRYLADLPIAFLKMEGALVRRATCDPHVRSILEGVQYTAARLGVRTIAEWVENAETAAWLREIGVSWAQGLHYGPPVRIAGDPARSGGGTEM